MNPSKLRLAKLYVQNLRQAAKEKRPGGSIRVAERCEEIACRYEDQFKAGLTYEDDFDLYVEQAEMELE